LNISFVLALCALAIDHQWQARLYYPGALVHGKQKILH
jgi:hypothetical protein